MYGFDLQMGPPSRIFLAAIVLELPQDHVLQKADRFLPLNQVLKNAAVWDRYLGSQEVRAALRVQSNRTKYVIYLSWLLGLED